MKKRIFLPIVFVLVLLCNYNFLFAHCDTMDGPVIADARKAIETNNVNYVLKWVLPENEAEISNVFSLVMKVQGLGPEAKELSDRYFFETLVRIHRSGEGVPYTGVQPSGTPIDEKILAADRSIASGNLAPLEKLVPKNDQAELKKRFERVVSLKNFDVNDVKAGREYIEAYVQFFHFAEGEEEGHDIEHLENGGHLSHIPWMISGVLFITTVLFVIMYVRKK
jgi:hypothetical protein